jgi:toxin FitB
MFLCDTNIISELARPNPNSGVINWISNLETIFISVITLEEIQFGLASRPNARIQAWFNQFLQTDCVVLPVTDSVALRSGQLRGNFRRIGQQRSQADILIAATALHYELTIATRNLKDFDNCDDLVLFNPFADLMI